MNYPSKTGVQYAISDMDSVLVEPMSVDGSDVFLRFRSRTSPERGWKLTLAEARALKKLLSDVLPDGAP